MVAEYTGPSVGSMLATHSLAQEIIARHNDPCPILGVSELVLLHEYVKNPAERVKILREHQMLDEPDIQRSLVGFVMRRQDMEDEEKRPFRQTDIQELRRWFGSGAVDEALAGKGRWAMEEHT